MAKGVTDPNSQREREREREREKKGKRSSNGAIEKAKK